MRLVIVTRHSALVALLRERHPDLVPSGTEILTHVEDPSVLDGAHVVGVLPLHLAALAARVTEIPLALGPTDRGQELSLERLREVAGQPRTFSVREITPPEGPLAAKLRAHPMRNGAPKAALPACPTRREWRLAWSHARTLCHRARCPHDTLYGVTAGRLACLATSGVEDVTAEQFRLRARMAQCILVEALSRGIGRTP